MTVFPNGGIAERMLVEGAWAPVKVGPLQSEGPVVLCPIVDNGVCKSDSVMDYDLLWLTDTEMEGMNIRHASDSALGEHQAVMVDTSSEVEVSF